ncbi:unnamed protein product, partial [marine sediment metagenome]
ILELEFFTKDDKERMGFTYIDPLKLSANIYVEENYDTKRKISYDLTFIVNDAKENIEKGITYLTELKKNINDIDKKKRIDYYIDIHKKSFKYQKATKKGICLFRCICQLKIHKKISDTSLKNGEFIDEFKEANDVISIFSKFKPKVKGFACNHFSFESDKYVLIGNIKFPIDIISNISNILNVSDAPFINEIVEYIGKPKINGFSIGFEKSPLGLENIKFEYKDNKYFIITKFNYTTNNIENIIKTQYLQTLNITKIFISEKNDKKLP